MISIKIIAALVAAILLLFFMLFLSRKSNKKLKKNNAQLKNTNEQAVDTLKDSAAKMGTVGTVAKGIKKNEKERVSKRKELDETADVDLADHINSKFMPNSEDTGSTDNSD